MSSVAVFYEMSELEEKRKQSEKLYLEFLRVPAMTAGVYVLAAGGQDPQRPHHEDEMYYVVRGRAAMKVGNEHRQVGPGSIVFVAANVQHRFFDVTEELVVLVFFAPAESQV